MLQFFIVFLTSALSGMGVGGGGLYILYLTLILDLPQIQAQGINLAFFVISALSSLFIHFHKRKIHLPLVLCISIFGAAGSLSGAYLSKRLSMALLSKAFGCFLVFCGLKTFFAK